VLEEDLPAVDYDVTVDRLVVENTAECSVSEMNDDSLDISEDVISTCVNSNKSVCFVNKSLECNFDAVEADVFDLNSVMSLDKASSKNDTTYLRESLIEKFLS
jgi:hypothetical protein